MSEREKVMEEEEEETIDHWSHEHPLSLVETSRKDICYGCVRRFSRGEKAYGCSKKCGYEKLLHEECAETARKIWHQSHPQHLLIQQCHNALTRCAVCRMFIWSIGYKCSSLGCKFEMHMRCAQGGGRMDAAADDDDDEQRRSIIINHPSHPKHELRLFGKYCSFKCDACGTTRRGKSYICTACQYWIHERCALLPQTIERKDHHHSLSLSFHVPPEYIKFDYKCDVCYKYLLPKYWIYHCELCRYVVHINCAFNYKSPHTTTNASNGKDIIHLPTNEVAEELITPFVMRQGGAIPDHDDYSEMVNVKYEFLHHQHQLTLISSSSHHDQIEEEEEEEEEDNGKRSKLICDGCITPISSSSSSSSKYYYMRCSECRYNLHMACFHLPPHLPSLPLHHQDDHDLILKSCDKLKPSDWPFCDVCYQRTNGLFYACRKCAFKADIKCASMPDTIYHAAHPQHLLKHVNKRDIDIFSLLFSSCAAGCDEVIDVYDCYTCYTCDFKVHIICAMLPASTTSRRWDKHHPLPLTWDASLNHPDDFCCNQCEKEMNPKIWMYHCRHCDLSFHPKCFPATSGICRNMKFGQEYVGSAAHPHPLTYQLLATKRRCDLCHADKHEHPGFHCASCNFFICFYTCGANMIEKGDIQAVD